MIEDVAQFAAADPFVPTPFTVVRRRSETRDTVTIALRPRNGADFPFQAGQFNMVSAFGIGEVPISVSSSPDYPEVLEHTIRAVGAVTRRLVALKPGDWVGIRGPFGQGWPLREAKGRDVVVVAGGLGLAPLRPVILSVLAHRDAYRRFVLLYGTRTPEDLLFKRELERWRDRFGAEVLVTVDRADTEWRGNVGVVPALFGQIEKHFDPANTIAMVCGPDVMMHFTVRELEKRGVADRQIYLSLERNMKCALAFCGHCQYGPYFICKDGPVFPYNRIEFLYRLREI